jgi:hypothetical protein
LEKAQMSEAKAMESEQVFRLIARAESGDRSFTVNDKLGEIPTDITCVFR